MLWIAWLLCAVVFGHVSFVAVDASSGFIRVSGTQFVDQDCRPFVYSGWNSWELVDAAAGVRSALPANDEFLNGVSYVDYKLDLAKESGFTVGRVFAHGHHSSALVLQYEPGVYNEQAWIAIDQLLDAASQRGLKLILTFLDNWKEVDSRPAYAGWAGLDGGHFYTDERIRGWFKDHVVKMVNRQNSINGRLYKEDPTIFAWNLMNEPRCDCNIRSYTDDCEKPCADNVQAWIEEMSVFLKMQDPNHMVTVGEEGFYGLESGREAENPDRVREALHNGIPYEEFLETYNLTDDTVNWAARSGQDFVRNHDMDSIDYAAMHLWPDNWGGLSIDFQARWMEAHAVDAAAMNKPLTLEEFGKTTESGGDEEVRNVRDPYFRAVYDTFDALKDVYPFAGIAFWEFDARYLDSPDSYTVYPTHSTFEEIVIPATEKIIAGVEASDLIENCFPGTNRSYDSVVVEGTTYITAGVNLLAVDEGTDVSEEIGAPTVTSCLESCESETECNAVSYNKATNACYLKSRVLDEVSVEVAWDEEGWQFYWRLPTEAA